MWILIVLLIPVAVIAIWLDGYIKKSEDNKKCEEGQKKYDVNVAVIAKHVCGLPLGEKSECKIYLSDRQVIIESSSNVFKLDKDKIADTSMKTSKEIQNSISGAVGGAMLFGPIGAFVGGSNTKLQIFLIFIYESKEGCKCISFEIESEGDRYNKARKFVEDFKNNITEKKEIEL